MAVKGSVSNTSKGVTLTFNWERISYSNIENKSTISWNLRIASTVALFYITASHSWDVKIDGKVISYGSNNPSLIADTSMQIHSGTTEIYHNPDGTKTFNVTAYQNLGAPLSISGISCSGSQTLDTIPRQAYITDAPISFTENDYPTITYENPMGEKVTSLEAGIGISETNILVPFREILKTGDTSYTFDFEDNDLYNLATSITSWYSKVVKFIVKTVIDGVTLYDSWEAEFHISAHKPTITPTIVDTNARTVALTGNSNTFVKYYSNAQFNTGAKGGLYADITSQYVINGAQRYDNVYTGTFEAVESNTFYFSATDSRGWTTNEAKTRTLIPYVKLTSNLTIGEMDANGTVTFTVKGKYFNGSFGATRNSMEVEFMVLDGNNNPVFNDNEDDGGWVRLGVVTPTVDAENNYTYSYTITGLHYGSIYELTVNVIDALSPIQTVTQVLAAIPVFDWGEDDFKHHTDVIMANNKAIYATRADGSTFRAIEPCNGSGHTVINWDSYDQNKSNTEIFGSNVKLNAKESVYVNGNILADFVIEQESNGTYYWRKWASGRVDLFGYMNIESEACNTALGNMYRTVVKQSPAFPFRVYNPLITMVYESNGYGAFLYPTTDSSPTKPGNFYLVRPTSSAAITGKVIYHVHGTLA